MSKKPTGPAAPQAADLSATLQGWLELVKYLEAAKPMEIKLRKEIAEHYFPAPKEGVNKVIIQYQGKPFELVMDHKINRKLDEAALNATMEQMPEELRQLGVLIQYKPSLVLSGFRLLTEGQQLTFAQCLTETPGAPGLELNEESAAMDPATAPAVADWPASNHRSQADLVGATVTQAQVTGRVSKARTASGTKSSTGKKKAAKKK